MKTVLLVLPRRISVRYTLSAGFLDLFKNEEDIKIVILTSIDDPKFVQEFSSERVVVEHIPMRDGKEFFFEKVLRQLRSYLGGIGQNIATFEAKSKMRGKMFWLGYKILSVVLRPFVFFRTWLRWVDYHIISYFTDKQYETLFAKYSPDLVVIHSVQELTAVPVARVAVRKKAPTLGIVLSWDNLTNKGEVYARTEKLTVWNEIMKEQAVRYQGYKPENVYVVGTAQFDYYIKLKDKIESRDEFFKRKGLDPSKKLIVYTTVPERIGGKEEVGIIDSVWKALDDKDIDNAQLLVRVYTKDRMDRYVIFGNKSGLVLDNPKVLTENNALGFKMQDELFMLDLAASLKYSDVIVNLVSTTTIDGAILKRPVINWAIGKKKYWYETEHYKYFLQNKVVEIAYSKKNLLNLIKESLRSPNLFLQKDMEIVKSLCGDINGSSLNRITKIILKIL